MKLRILTNLGREYKHKWKRHQIVDVDDKLAHELIKENKGEEYDEPKERDFEVDDEGKVIKSRVPVRSAFQGTPPVSELQTEGKDAGKTQPGSQKDKK